MAQSLATKYRPKTFEEMCGQKSIVDILNRQIDTNNVKNCYLFCGPSGIGKTTAARAFANKINDFKGSPIELDAASNNGVDNVRSIIEEAQSRSIESKYKIFIIDEAHAISNQGWQAFLKTLEEPPEYSIFIFCTTNPEKIPSTIQNRVMRFNLTKIPTTQIRDRLFYIADNEHFTNYEETCDYIAKISNGGMRDAIISLEKVADYDTDLNITNALKILGTYSYKDFLDLTNAIVDINQADILKILDKLDNEGKELKNFIDQYLSFILDLTKYSIFKDINITKLPLSLEENVKYSVGFQGNVQVFNVISTNLLEVKNKIRYDDNATLTVKASFISIMLKVQNIWKTS